MTLDEARAHVIKRFIYIESCVDSVLLKEVQPREDRINFVKEVLLNSAIIPTSNKFKLLRHLIKLNNWPSTKDYYFHRFLQIRNQFAHVGGKMHITSNVITSENRVEGELLFLLESLDNNGLLKKTNYKEALQEFDKHYSALRHVLHEIRDQTA